MGDRPLVPSLGEPRGVVGQRSRLAERRDRLLRVVQRSEAGQALPVVRVSHAAPQRPDAVVLEGGRGPEHSGVVRQGAEPTLDGLIEFELDFGGHGALLSGGLHRPLCLHAQIPYPI